VLQTTTATVSGSASRDAAYLALPAADVTVASDAGDLAVLRFGGATRTGARSESWNAQLRQSLSWRSLNNRHGFHTTAELRYEQATSRAPVDQGRFRFLSLADLAAGEPAIYSRTLGAPTARSAALSGAVSFGDSWTAAERLFVQYGVRADFHRFGARPAYNGAVDSLFGRRTDAAPSGIWPSPRFGFTWTRPVKWLDALHGGAGLFVGNFPTSLLDRAMNATGLPSGVRQLTCVGGAAPVPSWLEYVSDPARAPTRCADGTAAKVFSDTMPHVMLFTPNYRPPRSWRADLGWSTRFSGRSSMRMSARAEYSRSSAQPGLADMNFAGVPRFALASEGDRPVFVSPASIVPATGAVAAAETRRSLRFADVLEQRSDLHAEAWQYSLSLGKESATRSNIYRKGRSSSLAWTVTYAYGRIRDQVRGTNAPAVGDPNAAIWGRSSMEVRHSIYTNITTRLGNSISATLFGRLRSGMPFTPLVLGDVNGDGRFNDPAFVFDPATTTDPAVSGGMQTLLEGAPSSVRACLSRQLARVAERNSCTGPWSASLDAQAHFDLHRLGLPRGARATLSAVNLLGGIDQLLHGSNVRGWGQVASPDPVLLSVMGFDPAAQRFRYAVNQRFGDTRPARTVVRAPTQLTLQFSLPLGPNEERQQLRHAISRVEPGRRVRRSAREIRQLYAVSASPVALSLIQERDKIGLTSEQITQIVAIEREHRESMDSLWKPTAEHLAALPEPFNERLALNHVRAAQRVQREFLVRYVLSLREVLTPHQLEQLPPIFKELLNPGSIPEV
jgi:hypothetical protein